MNLPISTLRSNDVGAGLNKGDINEQEVMQGNVFMENYQHPIIMPVISNLHNQRDPSLHHEPKDNPNPSLIRHSLKTFWRQY